MSWGYVAIGAGTLLSGYLNSEATKDATKATGDAASQAVKEQQRQFNTLRDLLAPYTTGGYESLEQQRVLLGLGGPEEQQAAIEQIRQSPQVQELIREGEESILQNASATGGLRGGNTQAALAQFRPQILADAIQRQYTNLAGLTSLGQSSAAFTGNAGMTTAGNVGNILTQQGTNVGNAALARGGIYSDTIGSLAGILASNQSKPADSGGGGGGGGGGGSVLGKIVGGLGGLF